MQNLKKLFSLLTTQEKKRARIMIGMIMTMALLDMIGVASIMPFMAVLANPDLVENNAFLKIVYAVSSNFGINTTEEFLFLLGTLVFLLLVVSLAFKALTTYAQLRFTLMREYSIGKRLVEGYLHQPYSWFLSRHSADLGKTILSEVDAVINGCLMSIMNLIAQGAIATALLTLLILIDPKLALIVGLTLATAYALIFKAARGLLSRMGTERVEANQQRFTVVSEAFGACKEVKIGGLEQAYIQRFSGPAQTYARHRVWVDLKSHPRLALTHGYRARDSEPSAFHRSQRSLWCLQRSQGRRARADVYQ